MLTEKINLMLVQTVKIKCSWLRVGDSDLILADRICYGRAYATGLRLSSSVWLRCRCRMFRFQNKLFVRHFFMRFSSHAPMQCSGSQIADCGECRLDNFCNTAILLMLLLCCFLLCVI